VFDVWEVSLSVDRHLEGLLSLSLNILARIEFVYFLDLTVKCKRTLKEHTIRCFEGKTLTYSLVDVMLKGL